MSRSWLRDRVIYEVFPRNFSRTGDLPGVTAQLGRLAELGVGVVWLMPIHPVGRLRRKGSLGSPYAIVDHRAVDPALGGMAALRALVARAHELDLRVILDFVGNHGAWDGVVAREHPAWVEGDGEGNFTPASAGWTDVVGFRKDDPGLRRYLADTLRHWLREADVDGFRCDVAARLLPDLWTELRAAMDLEKPSAALLAEARATTNLGAFDLFYDNGFYRSVKNVIRAGAPVSAFWEAREAFLRERPHGAARMTFLENHDQRRAHAFLGSAALPAALVLLFCFEGTPLVYNGQEIGSCASTDKARLFEHRPIDWDAEEPDILRLHRELIFMRALRPSLARGDLQPLDPGCEGVVAFERRHGEERTVVAVNLRPTPARLHLPELALRPHAEILTSGGGLRLRQGVLPDVELSGWGWLVVEG